MNFEELTLDELKDYARSKGISFGKIGREKLIAKIKEKEDESNADLASSILSDIDSTNNETVEAKPKPTVENNNEKMSLLNSIEHAINELDDADTYTEKIVDDLPITTPIRVKSITYGGLTYTSKINNAIFRWDQIGSEQFMTIAELNEMNNYKRDFLNRPLVILMDDRAIRKFRLTKVYENVAKINNLPEVFASDMNTIRDTIDRALDVNMRDVLVSKVSQMIKKRALVDISVIHLLSKKLQYDFDKLLEEDEEEENKNKNE